MVERLWELEAEVSAECSARNDARELAERSVRDIVGLWAPPPEMTVSQWAEEFRYLSPEASAEPGKWHNNRTPYLIGIMDAISDPLVQQVSTVAASQIAKTELCLNVLGYYAHYDPSPMLFIEPTVEMAQTISKDRIEPMIRDTPILRGKIKSSKSRDSESTILHKKFAGGHITLVGANSPAGLASRPIRIVITDEEDRYPPSAGTEGNPSELAWKRATTFWNRKRIRVSSPGEEATSPIWKAFLNGTQEQWCMPCPDCGEYQPFDWGQIIFDGVSMSCKYCGVIYPEHVWKSLTGKWIAANPDALKERRHRSFQISALASPWVKWHELIDEFLQAKDDGPEYLRVFINTRLAQVWKDQAREVAASVVMDRQTEYDPGVVPPGTKLLTGGVDVQHDSLYWTVRAWGTGLTSWNVAHGQALDWTEVEKVMNREWRGPGGAYIVNLCAVDSGDQTDEVYDFCYVNEDWAIPVKGASNPMLSRYRISVINRPTSKANGTQFVLVDGSQYKTMIASRLMRPNGRGAWMVHKDCDDDYAQQVTAEHRVPEKKRGQTVYVWKKKNERAPNHYLDAEVYAACAADLMQVRYLAEGEVGESAGQWVGGSESRRVKESKSQRVKEPESRRAGEQGKEKMAGASPNWLNQKGNWL